MNIKFIARPKTDLLMAGGQRTAERRRPTRQPLFKVTIGTLAGQFKDDNFVEDKGIFGSNAPRNWSLFTLINHVGCGGAVEKERSEDCLNER